jgi:hypothetical protein
MDAGLFLISFRAGSSCGERDGGCSRSPPFPFADPTLDRSVRS